MNILDYIFKHPKVATELTRSNLPGRVYSIVFSPDNKRLAYGVCGITSSNSNLFISQIKKDSRIVHNSLFNFPDDQYPSVAISPNGKQLAAGRHIVGESFLEAWDFPSGARYGDISVDAEIVSSIAFSPDSRLLLTGAANPKHDMPVVNDKLLFVVSDISSAAGSRIYSDLYTAISWAESKSTSLPPQSKPRRFTAKAVRDFATLLKENPPSKGPGVDDGKRNAFDSTLRLWNAVSGKSLRKFDYSDAVNSVNISPDGRVGLSTSSEIVLWDLATGEKVKHLRGHSGQVRSAWFSPDGVEIISVGAEGTIRIWDVQSGMTTKIFRKDCGELLAAAISPNSRFAIIAGGNIMSESQYSLELWDLSLGNRIEKLHGHDSVVTAVAFNTSGTLAASVDLNEILILWNILIEQPETTPAKDWRILIKRHLSNFLLLHCPVAEDGVSRYGQPSWDHNDWLALLERLKSVGFGNIPSDEIGVELEKLASKWAEIPSILG